MLVVNLSFRPIGQGCFYIGEIKLNATQPFYFAYDCGTLSSIRKNLEAEIDEFKTKIKGRLDLLMISHFDNDHVNGVVRLLKEPKIKCRRIIIPYYTLEERLLTLAYNTNTDNEYREMMRNPIEYFSNRDKFDIDEVIVVGLPEPLEDGPPTETIFPENNLPIQRNAEDGGELPFEDVHDEERSKSFQNSVPESKTIQGRSKVLFIATPYRMTVGSTLWHYSFYLKKSGESILIEQFQKSITNLMKEEGYTVYDLFEPDVVTKMKDRYLDKIKGSINNTSLVTYHGPAFKREDDFFTVSSLCETEYQWGTLLTGDIELNGPNSSKTIVDYFKNYIGQICCFQVPHHGSKHNWYFNPKNTFYNCKFPNLIINHGLGRNHHPGIELITELQENCPDSTIHLNNELYSFNYSMSYFFKDMRILNDIQRLKPIRIMRKGSANDNITTTKVAKDTKKN